MTTRAKVVGALAVIVFAFCAFKQPVATAAAVKHGAKYAGQALGALGTFFATLVK